MVQLMMYVHHIRFDEKFKAFGFHVIEVDGHDFDDLKGSF